MSSRTQRLFNFFPTVRAVGTGVVGWNSNRRHSKHLAKIFQPLAESRPRGIRNGFSQLSVSDAALRVLILRVERSSQIFLIVSQFTLIRLSCTFLKMAVFERFRLNFCLESVLAFDLTDKLTGFAVIVPEKNDP